MASPAATWLSFHLPDDFVSGYADRPVAWGFDAGGGNSLGELTFIEKYSRKLPDGTKERWHDVCRRVVEGSYSVLKDRCKGQRTSWNEAKAQRSAKEAFDLMFNFKWTPPGRGQWAMGTEFVSERGAAALTNCYMVSTAHLSTRDVSGPFTRVMEASMLGIGCGYDTRGAGKLTVLQPLERVVDHVVDDSREGWCESLAVALEAWLKPGSPLVRFDYSKVRGAGEAVNGFGGTSAGPDPLRRLHEQISKYFAKRVGQPVDDVVIVDVFNLLGKAVVAGGSRRSAFLALDEAGTETFMHLKDPEWFPERNGPDGWGYLSNNSVIAKVGEDYSHVAEQITTNGEPGLLWLDLCRTRGRLADPPLKREDAAVGVNPCGEIPLYDREACLLVEVYLPHLESKAELLRTLKHAYAYAKTVSLIPFHWEDTNEVVVRNRRIGVSITGTAQFVEARGWHELRDWLDSGYARVRELDTDYSSWLGCRESIKVTTSKPSGTVSIEAGVTPGVHWPSSSGKFLRRVRLRYNDPLVPLLTKAGYDIEPDVMDPQFTVVVTYPVQGPEVRSEKEVSVWEKAALAALVQEYWADNSVSVTLTFSEKEKEDVPRVLAAFDGKFKSVSMLPLFEAGGAYAQMPYESCSEEEWERRRQGLKRINLGPVYSGKVEVADAAGEAYCNTDHCELPSA